MNALSKEDVVRNLFAAYLAEDRDAVDAIFSDRFRFTSPFDDHIDKATYFERCWRGSRERILRPSSPWTFCATRPCCG